MTSLRFRAAMAVVVFGSLAGLALSAEPKGKIDFSPGEKNKVSLFGIEGEGSKFVFVLDRSGSMGGPSGKALAAAKAELIASLEGIDSVQQFQLIFYNEHPRVFNPTGQPGRLAFGTDQNKRQARRFIESITSEGGTAHDEALVKAIRLGPDVVFLLTDADEPKLTDRDLERIDRLGPGITIHTIEFGTGPQREANNFLVRLAKQSGGRHTYVDVSKARDGKGGE
jgi:hypothetical protein